MVLAVFIIMGHLVVVMLLSVFLSKKGVSHKFSIFWGFIICGLLFGIITYFIDTHETRLLVNPFGARVADWLYRIWDPALNHPEYGREPSIPWILSPPQAYIFMTPVLYACIGLLSFLGGATSYLDPSHYLNRSGHVKEEQEEDKLESEPKADSET